ncbi:MAG: GPR endopeptidase [Clostridia bacterium]|nr:GPR endopeptidase [Clostridia bacterium]
MDFRTDLALERHELIKDYTPKGVESKQYKKDDIQFTKITVTDDEGAKKLKKPIGTYITAELPSLILNSPVEENTIAAIADELRQLIPPDGTIMIVGLGNSDITPDAIGPESASLVLATRHISEEIIKSTGLGSLRSTAVFTPGVLGKTGVETAESIKGIAEVINPSAVIVIDALAARRVSRLGCTVQISDTGISPGSGVGNRRNAINKDSVGVPVISIGIPTVVDVQTLVNDLVGNNAEISAKDSKEMIVTPREIDLVIGRASRLIGLTINKALQPHLSVDEIMMLVGS